MIYALTGHTQGIGKALYSQLENCIGFSKSTGYNILKKEDRKRIIKESKNCDVFINNASEGFGQTEMLLDLWYEWKDQNKTIINVGSRIADDDIKLPIYLSNLLEYRIQKLSLKNLCDDLRNINTVVKVKYCSFSYVGTERILKKYPHFTSNDFITVEEATKVILNA